MYVILWGHGFGTGGTSSVYRVNWVGGPTCEAVDIGHWTVAPGGVDSGVPNVVFGTGCSLNQLIRDDLPWPNHGGFVEHVNEVTDDMVALGLISTAGQERIISAAARSDIGKPGHRPAADTGVGEVRRARSLAPRRLPISRRRGGQESARVRDHLGQRELGRAE